MPEKLPQKVQQKYFCNIYKCTVVFKLKILNLQMISKNGLLYVQILSYFELFQWHTFIEYFCVTAKAKKTHKNKRKEKLKRELSIDYRIKYTVKY